MTNYSKLKIKNLLKLVMVSVFTVFSSTIIVGLLMTDATFTFKTYVVVALFASMISILPIIFTGLMRIYIFSKIENVFWRILATYFFGFAVGFLPGFFMFQIVAITCLLMTYYSEKLLEDK